MLDKNIIIEEILKALKKESILGFIVEEVEDSLDYLNKYKLKNIYDNLEQFVFDLKNINNNYINSL